MRIILQTKWTDQIGVQSVLRLTTCDAYFSVDEMGGVYERCAEDLARGRYTRHRKLSPNVKRNLNVSCQRPPPQCKRFGMEPPWGARIATPN